MTQLRPEAYTLPASEMIGSLQRALAAKTRLVITASPGAGKSTLLPLAMLDSIEGKILMLEPRRLAARQIAVRMASLIGEAPGQTVGYRIRHENAVSRSTRIEVLTEGILTRMLLDDPTLEGVGAVVFDEFHERSIHSDEALALTRQVQSTIRDDLRIVLMSATMDTAELCRALDAPLLTGSGRNYPVDIRYSRTDSTEETLVDDTVDTIRKALLSEEGDILAFLPGEGQIRRCLERLSGLPESIHVCPLHGTLSFEEQKRALEKAAAGERKVVLSTPIAETSLTIEGVRTVVDSGFCRRPSFDPRSSLGTLETVRISRDMADQRSGRAGRLCPGVCYRLWSRATQERLAACRRPEILDADLSSLCLDLALWGDASSLEWLTPPPQAAFASAIALLTSLGALERTGQPASVSARQGGCSGKAAIEDYGRTVGEDYRRVGGEDCGRVAAEDNRMVGGEDYRRAEGEDYGRVEGEDSRGYSGKAAVEDYGRTVAEGYRGCFGKAGDNVPERCSGQAVDEAHGRVGGEDYRRAEGEDYRRVRGEDCGSDEGEDYRRAAAEGSRGCSRKALTVGSFKITPHGRRLSALPCHPRIAQMMVRADGPEQKILACEIAAVLEDAPVSDETDICALIYELRRARTTRDRRWFRAIRSANQLMKLAGIPIRDSAPGLSTSSAKSTNSRSSYGPEQSPAAPSPSYSPGQNPTAPSSYSPGQKWATNRPVSPDQGSAPQSSYSPGQRITAPSSYSPGQKPQTPSSNVQRRSADSPTTYSPGFYDVDPYLVGALIAGAWPDRVGRAHSDGLGKFSLSSGGQATLGQENALSGCDWIAIASLNARQGSLGKIFLAAPLDPSDIKDLMNERDRTGWDSRAGCVVAERETRIGQLVYTSRKLDPTAGAVDSICEAAAKEGRTMFNFSDEVANLQRRVSTLSSWRPELDLPDLSTERVLSSAYSWLPPFIGKSTSVSELRKIDLCEALLSLLTYDQRSALDRYAPTHLVVPTGSRIRLEYRQGAEAPVLRVRLQECFGMRSTPLVNDGRTPVLMELLSPGYKPVQLTTDLASFWSGTYFEVRKELRRRYPKHSWPDNPLEAPATRKPSQRPVAKK